MHALLHELHSLNDLHGPDRCEGYLSGITNQFQAARGKGDIGTAQTKWKGVNDPIKKSIMKSVLQKMVIWIDTADAKHVVAIKDALYHLEQVDKVWIQAVTDA